jgi:hypothetical protein
MNLGLEGKVALVAASSRRQEHERHTNILRAPFFVRVFFFVWFRVASWINHVLPLTSSSLRAHASP